MESIQPKKAQKVLIVDDDATVRRALARQMRQLGYDTVEACDGEQGLTMTRLSNPEVVLLDLRMPKMDGHTFLKRLAEEQSGAAVIVLSGHADVRDRVEVMLAGVVQFVQKPWSREDLIGAMDRAQKRQHKLAATGGQ